MPGCAVVNLRRRVIILRIAERDTGRRLKRLRPFPQIPQVNKPQDANRGISVELWSGVESRDHHHCNLLKWANPLQRWCRKSIVTATNWRAFICRKLQLPLATYTGWNLRDPSIGAPEQRESFEGSYIPISQDRGATTKERGPETLDRGTLREPRRVHRSLLEGAGRSDSAARAGS